MQRKSFIAAGAAAVAAGSAPRAARAADPFRLIITETDIPLVPNSVEWLALSMGYFKRAGVDVELIKVQQTPSAVAALHAGQGEMANIGIDVALQRSRTDRSARRVFARQVAAVRHRRQEGDQ